MFFRCIILFIKNICFSKQTWACIPGDPIASIARWAWLLMLFFLFLCMLILFSYFGLFVLHKPRCCQQNHVLKKKKINGTEDSECDKTLYIPYKSSCSHFENSKFIRCTVQLNQNSENWNIATRLLCNIQMEHGMTNHLTCSKISMYIETLALKDSFKRIHFSFSMLVGWCDSPILKCSMQLLAPNFNKLWQSNGFHSQFNAALEILIYKTIFSRELKTISENC